MTTFAVPPTGAPAWREIYPSPPRLRPEGWWCPLDDTVLQPRPDGWVCPACLAGWDFQGLTGRWLPEQGLEPVRWRLSPVHVVGGVTGCALIAAGLAVLLDTLDERVVLLLAGLVAAAAVTVVAVPAAARFGEWRRFRHNQVIAIYDRRTLPAAGSEEGQR